jgi:hypothetical protein
MLRCFYFAIGLLITTKIIPLLIITLIIMPILVGVFFEASYGDTRDKYEALKHKAKEEKRTVTMIHNDHEAPNEGQVTSVPEKGIEDEA